jgi:hypothetical protein
MPDLPDPPVTTRILRKSMPTFDLQSGATAVIAEKIDWDDIENRYIELFGATFVQAAGFTFAWQAAHPDWNWLLAKSATIEPFFPEGTPPDASAGYPDGARLTITYTGECLNANASVMTYSPEAGTYLTHTIEAASEQMMLKGHELVYDAPGETHDGKSIKADVEGFLVIPLKMHRLRWTNLTSVPTSLWDSLIGSTNNANYAGGEAGTLLLEGYTTERGFDSEGATKYAANLTVTQRRIVADDGTGTGSEAVFGWNHRFAADKSPNWQLVKNKASGKPPFRLKNWSNLLVQ